MTLGEYRQLCVQWVSEELPRDINEKVRAQYFNTGCYGGYLSIYDFIKDHRQDLYQQFIAWLAEQKLTGELK